MSEPEIILNLWYVCDDLGFIYSLRARAYIGMGSDEEKLAFLKKFSMIDYLIARIFTIPTQFQINGKPLCHKEFLVAMGGLIALFDEAIQAIQNDLPSQTSLNVPARPLVCMTPLLGDDDGKVQPKIDEEIRFY